MKNSELIATLQTLSPDAEVTINIMQSNKVYGKQLGIKKGSQGAKNWVDSSYNGATITVHLPHGAFISKWNEEVALEDRKKTFE